jgi:translation initiation factor 2B subunit (eIF-2B alpha/beta/delta family)
VNLPLAFFYRIVSIRANRSDGAFELARRAAEASLLLLPDSDLAEAASLIEAAQPTMAPLVHLARRLRASTNPAWTGREFLEELVGSNAAIARHVPTVFTRPAVVVTYSASATVLEFLLAGGELVTAVIAMESQPGGEGRKFAQDLRSRGLRAEVARDSELASAVARSNLALTGADWISPTHVINKIGTAALCQAARERKVPVYCIASKLKILPFDPPPDESGLFEPAPRDLFTAIVTEDGVSADAVHLSRRVTCASRRTGNRT